MPFARPVAAGSGGPGSWLEDLLVVEMGDRIAAGATVLRVSEAAAHPFVAARKIIVNVSGFAGHDWPLLGSPMTLSKTPPVFGQAG